MVEATSPTVRIVTISSPEEATFARKFLIDIITVSFNKNYVAFSSDASTAFVYPTRVLWNSIISIFQDPTLIKLISKPAPALKSFLNIFPTLDFGSSFLNSTILGTL